MILPERRSFTVDVRASDGGRRLTGHAAVFDQESEDLGGFRETFRPGAFSWALRSRADVRALWNHDSNLVLGRTKSGTLALEEDGTGLRFDVDLPRTSWARDVLVTIDRGDVSGASVGFAVPRSGANWIPKGASDGLDLREITSVWPLWDTSVVTFPAYPETHVGLRQLRAVQHAGERSGVDLLALAGAFGRSSLDPRLVRPIVRKLESLAAKGQGGSGVGLSSRYATGARLQAAIRSDPEVAWRLAVHEAGHGVICVLDGLGIDDLGIEAADGLLTRGWCRARVSRSVDMLMGGIGAETMAFGDYRTPTRAGPWASDWCRALEKVGGDEGKVFRRLGLVTSTLNHEWAAVKQLARAVFESGELDGADAERIVEATLRKNLTGAQLFAIGLDMSTPPRVAA